jgi:hypothetical protein
MAESRNQDQDQWENNLPGTSKTFYCKPQPVPSVAATTTDFIVPVPMPRSISFRRVPKESNNSPPESIFSPETREQRSKKRRSQSMDDIFGSKLKSQELDLDQDFRVSRTDLKTYFTFSGSYILLAV